MRKKIDILQSWGHLNRGDCKGENPSGPWARWGVRAFLFASCSPETIHDQRSLAVQPLYRCGIGRRELTAVRRNMYGMGSGAVIRIRYPAGRLISRSRSAAGMGCQAVPEDESESVGPHRKGAGFIRSDANEAKESFANPIELTRWTSTQK